MIFRNFPPAVPGQKIQAAQLNRPVQSCRDMLGMRAGQGLKIRNVAGVPLIEAVRPQRQKARLIAWSLVGYTWQGIYDIAGGAWADLPAAVSDLGGLELAYEYNINSTLPAGTQVELERSPWTGEWRFQFDKCP